MTAVETDGRGVTMWLLYAFGAKTLQMFGFCIVWMNIFTACNRQAFTMQWDHEAVQ